MTPDNTGYPPPEKPPQTGTAQVFQKLNEKVILLSCFDGIGSAAVALRDLLDSISLHITWEVDE